MRKCCPVIFEMNESTWRFYLKLAKGDNFKLAKGNSFKLAKGDNFNLAKGDSFYRLEFASLIFESNQKMRATVNVIKFQTLYSYGIILV